MIDRHARAGGAQAAQDLGAVDVGHRHVEDDRRRGATSGVDGRQRAAPVGRLDDRVAAQLERAAQLRCAPAPRRRRPAPRTGGSRARRRALARRGSRAAARAAAPRSSCRARARSRPAPRRRGPRRCPGRPPGPGRGRAPWSRRTARTRGRASPRPCRTPVSSTSISTQSPGPHRRAERRCPSARRARVTRRARTSMTPALVAERVRGVGEQVHQHLAQRRAIAQDDAAGVDARARAAPSSTASRPAARAARRRARRCRRARAARDRAGPRRRASAASAPRRAAPP